MKRLMALVLVLLMVFGFAACAQGNGDDSGDTERAVLRVGMECDYAPFNWTQSEPSDRTVPIASGGYADGYDVQMAKLIAEALNMDLEIVKIEWDGLPLALQTGEIDAIIAGMSPLPERKLTIDFTDAYYESELVIVVLAEGIYADAQALSDFSGARITGQLNTFHYSVIDQIPGVDQQVAMESFPAMIVALQSGAIDGYVSERPGAVSAITANPSLSYVEFAVGQGFTASPEDVSVCVGVAKGNSLQGQINAVLAGITNEQRQTMMDEAVANQPLAG